MDSAVHLFAKTDKRRCLVPNCKDKLCLESGNKRNYERILFFGKKVAEQNEKKFDIFKVVLDSEWKSSIHSFKAKWKVSDRIKLTPLEKKLMNRLNFIPFVSLQIYFRFILFYQTKY